MAIRLVGLLARPDRRVAKYPGGGVQLSTSQAFQLNRTALERPDLQLAHPKREARILNMTELGRTLNEVDDPPVKAIVVYNSNPAAIAPDQHACAEACAAATSLPSCSSSSRPTPPISRISSCRSPRSSNTPTCISPTATTICNWRAPL